jgi:predicted Zn-dependent protease with MMP-like domain
MTREKFEHLTEEALRSIPGKFKRFFDNLSVMVEDYNPRSRYILGIYHGVPYKHRGPYYGNVAPDVIVLYQRAIEDICRSEEEVKDQIQKVLIHEIGHYFGFSEAELREVERNDSKPE